MSFSRESRIISHIGLIRTHDLGCWSIVFTVVKINKDRVIEKRKCYLLYVGGVFYLLRT